MDYTPAEHLTNEIHTQAQIQAERVLIAADEIDSPKFYETVQRTVMTERLLIPNALTFVKSEFWQPGKSYKVRGAMAGVGEEWRVKDPKFRTPVLNFVAA